MINIELLERETKRDDLPQFSIGDTVKILINVKEADKVRVQPLVGTVIMMKGRGASRSFTVRKISFGTGLERTFPMNCPSINSIKVMKRGKTRRAKLYYLRDKSGKMAKVQEKKDYQKESKVQ